MYVSCSGCSRGPTKASCLLRSLIYHTFLPQFSQPHAIHSSLLFCSPSSNFHSKCCVLISFQGTSDHAQVNTSLVKYWGWLEECSFITHILFSANTLNEVDLNFSTIEKTFLRRVFRSNTMVSAEKLISPHAEALRVQLLSGSSNEINIDFNTDQSDEFFLWCEDAACFWLGFHHLVHFSSQHCWWGFVHKETCSPEVLL